MFIPPTPALNMQLLIKQSECAHINCQQIILLLCDPLKWVKFVSKVLSWTYCLCFLQLEIKSAAQAPRLLAYSLWCTSHMVRGEKCFLCFSFFSMRLISYCRTLLPLPPLLYIDFCTVKHADLCPLFSSFVSRWQNLLRAVTNQYCTIFLHFKLSLLAVC